MAFSVIEVRKPKPAFALRHAVHSEAGPAVAVGIAGSPSEALALARDELVTWLPRVLYALVALWMLVQLLGQRAPVLPDGVARHAIRTASGAAAAPGVQQCG